MTHVLLALLLTSAQLNSMQQNLENQFYQKLTPLQQALVKSSSNAYTYGVYRKDGTMAPEPSGEEAALLKEVELVCDQKMMDNAWSGVFVEPKPLAIDRVACANVEFTKRGLPYTAGLVELEPKASN